MTPGPALAAGRAFAARLWRTLTDPSIDPRVRSGRVGAAMWGLGCLVGAVAIPVLPDGVDRPMLYLLLGTGLVMTALIAVMPWQRLPGGAQIVPVVAGLLVDGAGIGVLGHAMAYFLAFFVLSFVYVGLTQPPGTALAVSPLAVLSGVAALEADSAQATVVALAITIVVGVLVGELLAQHNRAQRQATETLDVLVTTVRELTGCTTAQAAVDVTTTGALALLRADAVLLALVDPRTHRQVVRSVQGCPPSAVGQPLPELPAAGRLFLATSSLAQLAWAGVASALQLPLTGPDGAVAGVVVGVWERPRLHLDSVVTSAIEMLIGEAGKAIGQLRHAEELARQAGTDPLTGLANRRVLFRELAHLAPGEAVVVIDLDHFKQVNDTRGHGAGDDALASFGAVVAGQLRDSDCAARYGGEEFAVIVRGDGSRGAASLLHRIRTEWARRSTVTLSAGVAVHLVGVPPQATLAAADRAVYAAKAAGRNRVHYAEDDAGRVALRGLVLPDRPVRQRAAEVAPVPVQLAPEQCSAARAFLDRVAGGDGFAIALQPIVRVGSGSVVAAEALTRFVDPPLNLPVDAWFRLAAELGVGCDVERAVAWAGVRLLEELPTEVGLSVNLSPTVLCSPDLVTALAERVSLARLIIEITEQDRVEDYDALVDALAPLRAGGVRLAVDDAGAGYASFRHILRLEPDYIKLDRALISGIDRDPGLRALTTALVSFAREIDAEVIGEGVERPGEFAILARLGVAGAQGYHLARPSVDRADWARWLAPRSLRAVG